VSETLLRLEGVSYRYPGTSDWALRSIDLELNEGELVLVAGASASGKSTLLRTGSALVPHFHGGEFAGRALVGGLDTRDSGPAEVAAVASSLFQDPESQVVMNGVRSELALPLENRGEQPAAIARAIEETAIALGIDELLERPLHTLSGGELQRVALGAALVTRPRLLLLDEPTSQLDPVAGDELVWQLRRLNEEWGTTVLLAEHRIERCLAAADRVLALEQGRLAFDGAPRAFVVWAATHAPELVPPVARMCALAGIEPLPLGVKDARRLLGERGLLAESRALEEPAPARRRARRFRRRGRMREGERLAFEGIWLEYGGAGRAPVEALRGVDLSIGAGDTVALLGRNGAGKSTLLKIAAGLLAPGRGRVRRSGEVALLLQNPSDYFLHERASDELPREHAQAALVELGIGDVADSDPHDLSGGQRQRLALAIVLAGRGLGGGEPPAVVALDEPTRGMDRARKLALAERLRALAGSGAAVVVATHDVEFAARVADRSVLLGRGRVIADGRTTEVLCGGRYFATEVARVLGPEAQAVLPEQGARILVERLRSGLHVSEAIR
jgi:energy-coupling factor transporter ATP-binding protein EcfA2